MLESEPSRAWTSAKSQSATVPSTWPQTMWLPAASNTAIEPSTSYPVNCMSPGVTSCIEKDRHVIAARLPAGEYRIRVVGMQGGSPCWLSDQREQVRAAGLGRSLVLPMTKTCK